MHMSWEELAFLHWPVDAEELRPFVPPPLGLETWDGKAWLGVVPFFMRGVRPRFTPSVPGISAFPELNLRTYVTAEGKPGVWFFSLDVTKRLTVVLARKLFHLPYNKASMKTRTEDGWVHYASARAEGDGTFGFTGRYRGLGDITRAVAGSIDAWLTERYCLYSADDRGRVFRGDIHHEPWPLQKAECEIQINTVADAFGISALQGEPLAHFVRKLDVVAWTLEPVRGDA